MDCDAIPEAKAEKAIRLTKKRGTEHGFIICNDSGAGEIQQGDKDSLDLQGDCKSGKMGIFHVHPNDVLHLSPQDEKVLNDEDVSMVCVGDTENNVKCELSGNQRACVEDYKDD